ncbi:MAG TPA: methanogenesis marker 12 protein [Methanocorpusculum sp.]|nr:methanogenesis marker 12 protein [Candidatus Methanocorpusculum equi]MCQ2357219.1 methanogenesis marker 12 protein [Methanocorpusculum sp.]HJJ32846.1 methanogenesis marker 12 protein [Methanocorpusculum sp.]HJJ44356.1 methanogenesis marker 12 protein [Methanocorpusculum sp.]
MFIGIDHGTTSLRFAADTGEHFKITREAAASFELSDLEQICSLSEIEGIALCYSMGDNFNSICDVKSLKNRGVVTREGAGKHIGGGTRVFDVISASDIPAVAFPGIHRGSDTDPRFKIYSHQTSPEKIGIAYLVRQKLNEDSFVVSDISSNTVSLLVSNNKIIGAFDACVFAPGTQHGALDVDAIRRIDSGEVSANEAFTTAGVSHHMEEKYRKPTVAMWAAMECASLLLLHPDASVALAGSLAPELAEEISALLNKPVAVFDEWAASLGLSHAARDVFGGAKEILGIPVAKPLPKRR